MRLFFMKNKIFQGKYIKRKCRKKLRFSGYILSGNAYF